MIVRQTRIFVPNTPPFDGDTWTESILGNVIAPLAREHPSLQWFWFSRYVQPRADSGDCDISEIPEKFAIDELFRSVRFRYAIPEEEGGGFEHRARELIDASGARISDFRRYDWVADLGGDRFVGQERSDSRRENRAELVANCLSTVCRLTLDCLRGPDQDGRYRFEENDSDQNPHGSTFESLHHLFCNITNVPTSVLVIAGVVGTHWSPPAAGGPAHEIPVRF
jgi:hypothetical protein